MINDSATICHSNDNAQSSVTCLEEIESLVKEFQRLLVRHETSLEGEGVREHLEQLERWAESYRRGLKAAEKIAGTGQQWLKEAHEKLQLAAEELQRMEGESPAAVSSDQHARTEELLKAKKRLDALIPAVEQAVTPVVDASVVAAANAEKKKATENA